MKSTLKHVMISFIFECRCVRNTFMLKFIIFHYSLIFFFYVRALTFFWCNYVRWITLFEFSVQNVYYKNGLTDFNKRGAAGTQERLIF